MVQIQDRSYQCLHMSIHLWNHKNFQKDSVYPLSYHFQDNTSYSCKGKDSTLHPKDKRYPARMKLAGLTRMGNNFRQHIEWDQNQANKNIHMDKCTR